MQLMASRTDDGRRVDLDTTRTFLAPASLAKGSFITGVTEMPLVPGIYHLSVLITQDDGRGALAKLDRFRVIAPAPTLQVSDLVLGRTGSGVSWNSGTATVPLNPFNSYPAGGNAEVYLQIGGLVTGQSYDMRFDISRTDDPPNATPRLSLASKIIAERARMEITRTLGLGNLDPARYRLRVTIHSGDREVTAMGVFAIVK